VLIRDRFVLWPFDGPVPDETRLLEAEGWCMIRSVFAGRELADFRDAVLAVFANMPGDRRGGLTDATVDMFRYQICNRSALAQMAMAHPRILAVVEPLVGGDCHVINSTAWHNPPGLASDAECYYWHIDGGPYVPRLEGVPWPSDIPYPIFVIGTHIYLEDCTLDDGPTSVVPTSHRSGRSPIDRRFEAELEYQGHRPVCLVARAGDVGCFVSDSWHRRRLPTERSSGRLFLQTNYGRREIAQRLLPTDEANQASPEARARALTPRERTLLGLHAPGFYDG
jgi:ectoine hydroxylase-related dioxygenase (phytanoyl-CoA dioxygenase family)